MQKNVTLIKEIQKFLDKTMVIEMKQLYISLRTTGIGAQKMAAKSAAEMAMRKYEGISIVPMTVNCWESMSAGEKVTWWLAKKLLTKSFRKIFRKAYFEEYKKAVTERKSHSGAFPAPPLWLASNPREELAIVFRIEIPIDYERTNSCR